MTSLCLAAGDPPSFSFQSGDGASQVYVEQSQVHWPSTSPACVLLETLVAHGLPRRFRSQCCYEPSAGERGYRRDMAGHRLRVSGQAHLLCKLSCRGWDVEQTPCHAFRQGKHRLTRRPRPKRTRTAWPLKGIESKTCFCMLLSLPSAKESDSSDEENQNTGLFGRMSLVSIKASQ